MGYPGNFFKYAWGILLVLAILFLLGQLRFFLEPLQKSATVLFFPVLVSGFFYYLLKPLIQLGERFRIPKTPAILFTLLFLIFLLALFGFYAGSFATKQLQQLLVNLPQILDAAKLKAEGLLQANNFGAVFSGRIGQEITTAVQKVLPFLTGHIFYLIAALADTGAVLVLVPFILFYFLKEDQRFALSFRRRFPKSYQNEIWKMMEECDGILTAYITGQVVIALLLGILLYGGYLLMGVHYPLVLALFAFITSFIPMFGAIIGVIPAVFIGLVQNVWLALKVIILAVVIHFLANHLISPQLIGKRLKIHPLTIIFLFLIAAPLFGFLGVLVIVPLYAVMKVIIKGFLRLLRIKRMSSEDCTEN